jgi:hypothetical protein
MTEMHDSSVWLLTMAGHGQMFGVGGIFQILNPLPTNTDTFDFFIQITVVNLHSTTVQPNGCAKKTTKKTTKKTEENKVDVRCCESACSSNPVPIQCQSSANPVPIQCQSSANPVPIAVPIAVPPLTDVGGVRGIGDGSGFGVQQHRFDTTLVGAVPPSDGFVVPENQ